MPALSVDFFSQLKDNYKKYKVFVETGTFMGETIFNMEPHFNNLYTIEIAPHYFNNTRKKYKGSKINFILGDSSDVLLAILPLIMEDSIFFLDGHWSADDTGKGLKDCPLEEECMAINELFQGNAILIIDDFRLFGKGPHNNTDVCDWKDISKNKLVSVLESRITDIYHLPSNLHKEDRLIIHIKAKE